MADCPKCRQDIPDNAVECPCCGVIVAKARDRRRHGGVGGTAPQPASAAGRESVPVRPFTANRESLTAPFFRVYADSHRLVFTHLGRGSQTLEGVEGGLRAQLGGFGSVLVRPFIEGARRKLESRIHEFDRRGAEKLLGESKKNFELPANVITRASLKSSGMLSTHHGRLIIETNDRGKLSFSFPEPESMAAAENALRSLLGRRLTTDSG